MNEFDFSVLTAGEPAQFGKYGSLRLRYLKENKPTLYQALLQGHFPALPVSYGRLSFGHRHPAETVSGERTHVPA